MQVTFDQLGLPACVEEGLSPEFVEELFARAVRCEYPQGALITRVGQMGGRLSYVLKGRIHFSLMVGGNEQILAFMGPGGVFGELCLFGNLTEDIHVYARDRTVVMAWSEEEVRSAMETIPAVARYLIKVLSRKVNMLISQVRALALQDARSRIAQTIYNLAEIYGEHGPDGIAIKLPLTQKDLAKITATSRITVNKCLQQLRRDGICRRDNSHLVVTDREHLHLIARGSGSLPPDKIDNS